jgi:hypothetical protein
MRSKKKSTKKSSSNQQKNPKPIELWLLGNINAVVKITKAILNLDKAILSARKETVPSLVTKKTLLETANAYLIYSRDILLDITSNPNSTPPVNIEELSDSAKCLIRQANSLVIHAVSDIDYAKSSIYSTIEGLSSRKQNLKDDFKKSLDYLNLAIHYLLLGLDSNSLKDQ